MITCKECNSNFETNRKLCKHYRDKHTLTTRKYYDLYIRKPDEGSCHACGNETSFKGLSHGYSKFCGGCGSERAKAFRLNLRQDDTRFEKFRDKVSANQTRIWKKRVGTGENKVIQEKIRKTINGRNLELGPDELRKKYGWLNHLPPEEKEIWKNEVMFQTGMYQWWKNASDEQINEVVKKRIATITKISELLAKSSREDPENYEKYKQAVWYITSVSYGKFKKTIDPDLLRSNDYHLDHKFSIKAGFLHQVPPEIIGSVHNLRVIPALDNIKKGAKCSITKENLIEEYKNGNI